jgi:hypothetical protein
MKTEMKDDLKDIHMAYLWYVGSRNLGDRVRGGGCGRSIVLEA